MNAPLHPQPDGASVGAEDGFTPRSVVVRAVRAAPRVYLSQVHLEQLFGGSYRPTVVWGGLLGEPLCLERVTVSAGNRKELKVRVCASPAAQTRLALTQSAVHVLDLRGVPAFGMEGTAGAALSGPKGAVVLTGGVCRAAVRLVLPEGVARKAGVRAGQALEVAVPSLGELLEPSVVVEVRPGLKEGVVVVDGPLGDRMVDSQAITVRLAAPRLPGT